jgi:D-alanyl-D-alanine carboxypeptidase/D-alanyl-D-alanine-endopeptidase (penicillin-binding protein 4)
MNKCIENMKHTLVAILLATALFLSSCSIQQRLASPANQYLLNDSSLLSAHIGISVFNPETGKHIYTHQGDKLFIPASNTKIITCYAAMNYLPKSLPAAYITDLDTAVVITPTGDPTFLHPYFDKHPLFDAIKKINKPIYISNHNWNTNALGQGWSWEDYSEHYMNERSAFPIYGNQIHWFQEKGKKENPSYPGDTVDLFIYSNPEVTWPVEFATEKRNAFHVERAKDQNAFTLFEGKESQATYSVPFITSGIETGIRLLEDSLGKKIFLADASLEEKIKKIKHDTIYSQPTDSMLKIMMHNSDNFFADQSLEMVSQQKLNTMDEALIINDLLSSDLVGLPQKPRWVDGSGLSRYTLFSPDDIIFVLNKLRQEQPFERIKSIFLQTGHQTLSSHDSTQNEFLIAKSGSMGGIYCLSGYIISQKKKVLIFSIMVNNTKATSTKVSKQIRLFLERVAATH